MTTRMVLLTILVSLLFTGVIWGQKREYNYSFQTLSVNEGLSEGINAWVFKDSYGFVWISSMDGLNRFDGKSVKVYRPDPADDNSLADNIVTSSFFEDAEGNLWFTTYSAINVYLRKYDHFETIQLEDSNGQKIVEDYFAFHMDGEQRLWVRTGIRDEGTLHQLDIDQGNSKIIGSLRGQRISVMSTGESGQNIIISSRLSGSRGLIISSLSKGDQIQSRFVFHPEDDQDWPTTVVYSVLEEGYPEMWLATDLGLINFNADKNTYEIHNTFNGQSIGKIKSVVRYQNQLLTTSDDLGILIFNLNTQKFESNIVPQIENNFSLRRKDISRLFLDRDNCLWVSYFENGVRDGLDYSDLKRYRFPTFKIISAPSTRPSELSITENGSVFVGRANELKLLNGDFKVSKSWSFSSPIKLVRSTRNTTWVVLQKNEDGVYNIYKKTVGQFEFDLVSQSEVQVEDLLELSSGRVILATTDGIYEVKDPQKLATKSKSFDEASNAWVFHLFEDNERRVYMSSNYDRLYIYTMVGDQPKMKASFSGVGGCKSFHLWEDQQKVWTASSMGIGEVDLQTDSFRFISQSVLPIPQQKYLDLQIREKDCWFKTERGLIQYNLKDSTLRFYSTVDGVVSVRGLTAPSIIDKNERIWISGQDGINIFHPDSVVSLAPPPAPQIVEININDAPMTTEVSYASIDSMGLSYNENTVSFEFVPCQYGDAKNIRYQYRLQGYDENWVESKSSGYARYFSLPPGQYTFQARTGNTDGQWSENPTTIALSVKPPYWATIWAYLFYAAVLIGLLLYWRYLDRRKQQRKLEREQRKLEQEKRVNDELRKIDKLKDQFLANTSHELRTPLNGIIGLAESLMDGATGELTPDTKENLQMIASSGKRLSNLVNDILDFSRIKSEDLKLNIKAVDLYSAVDVVLRLLNPLRVNTSVQMINKVPRDLPHVAADEDRLQQILYNLIGNAIKFTRQGVIVVSAKENNGQIEVEVSDTGIGIAEKEMENIFRSFEQGDGGTTREFGGTGLGLSVTRQLVELHEGKIWVNSEVEKGSKFYFSLNKAADNIPKASTKSKEEEDTIVPLMKSETSLPAPMTEEEMEKVRDGVRILIVDDEPVNRKVLHNHLKTAGFLTFEAKDGQEALDMLETDHFDLILLDIMMPGLSGFEVCSTIRIQHSAIQLPVIMLTAKNRVADLVQGFTAGANDYLTKPFSKDELMARIGTHLSLRQIYSATGKFVPYEFLNAIGHDQITQVKRGDHRQVEVTVMFADIRDFTTLSETMTPTENFKFVNAFVGRMGPIIQANKGFVNQYLGDGIMAIFPETSESAMKAASGMMRELRAMNEERDKSGEKRIRIGIGMHTGPLIMGIIGDEHRTDPATIADTVNTSARLEGLTKYYKAGVIVSEQSVMSFEDRNDKNFRFLGKVKLKGKTAVTGIYELIDADSEELMKFKIDTHDDFTKAMELYQTGNLQESHDLFLKMNQQEPRDLVVDFFLNKLQALLEGDLPPDWEAVEVMKQK